VETAILGMTSSPKVAIMDVWSTAPVKPGKRMWVLQAAAPGVFSEKDGSSEKSGKGHGKGVDRRGEENNE